MARLATALATLLAGSSLLAACTAGGAPEAPPSPSASAAPEPRSFCDGLVSSEVVDPLFRITLDTDDVTGELGADTTWDCRIGGKETSVSVVSSPGDVTEQPDLMEVAYPETLSIGGGLDGQVRIGHRFSSTTGGSHLVVPCDAPASNLDSLLITTFVRADGAPSWTYAELADLTLTSANRIGERTGCRITDLPRPEPPTVPEARALGSVAEPCGVLDQAVTDPVFPEPGPPYDVRWLVRSNREPFFPTLACAIWLPPETRTLDPPTGSRAGRFGVELYASRGIATRFAPPPDPALPAVTGLGGEGSFGEDSDSTAFKIWLTRDCGGEPVSYLLSASGDERFQPPPDRLDGLFRAWVTADAARNGCPV